MLVSEARAITEKSIEHITGKIDGLIKDAAGRGQMSVVYDFKELISSTVAVQAYYDRGGFSTDCRNFKLWISWR